MIVILNNCLCFEKFVDALEPTLKWIMLSISAKLDLEISMNISISNLIYLVAGAAFAGELGGRFPRSREAFQMLDEPFNINIGLSAGEVRFLPLPPY